MKSMLEPDPIPLFKGKIPAAREFSAVFRLKAHLNGTVFVEKPLKNPGPGVLAGQGGWVRFLGKFKPLLYAPVIGLIILFGPLSSHSVSAQSMGTDMNHDQAGIEVGTNSCGTCVADSAVNLPEKQKQLIREHEQDPEPPEQLHSHTQNPQFPEPQKPADSYIYGGTLLKPPDLVKLYANFRF